MKKRVSLLKQVLSNIYRHRKYFESNVTSYTYLLFAQASIIAENTIWRAEFRGSFGKILIHSPQGFIAIIQLILSYIFPLFFICGAFITFKYPRDKFYVFESILINIMLSIIILISPFYM
ncbi:MAG TPA: hypothetical protein VLG12_06730 [Candidatus Saccharimonadales bacterium]|nr:hypothetical protein [Candidatus Saccharimonadales bacterium]